MANLRTLIAWDYNKDGGQTTNIICEVWDVDPEAGTASQSGYPGSDGFTARRESNGWVPEEDFAAKANQYCAV